MRPGQCDILARSEQSRLRAWTVLQQMRAILEGFRQERLASPAQRSFAEEGDILTKALLETLFQLHRKLGRLRTISAEAKTYLANPNSNPRFPHMLQEFNKALDVSALSESELMRIISEIRAKLDGLS